MERSTTVNHRTTEDAKKNFNDAFVKLLAECSPDLTFTKEDFFEALLNKATVVNKRDVLKIIEASEIG
jgi:hypothetical protein